MRVLQRECMEINVYHAREQGKNGSYRWFYRLREHGKWFYQSTAGRRSRAAAKAAAVERVAKLGCDDPRFIGSAPR